MAGAGRKLARVPVGLSWALAWALTGPVELEWRAPDGCARGEAVVAEVERLLAGRTPARAAVRADVSAEGAGVAATVVIAGAAPRVLRAGGCEALAQAVAVVIAVAVDPGLADTLAPGPAAPELVPPPPEPVTPSPDPASDAVTSDAPARVAVTPTAAAPTAPPERRRPRVSHAIGARAGALIGLSDLPTAAIGLTYALARGLLRVEARAQVATPRRSTYDDARDGPGVRVQALTLGALGCVSPGGATVRVPLCLGAEAGPMIGQGIGVANPQTRASLWASGLLTAGLVGRVHRRLDLLVGAELGVALRRPAFHVGEREALVRSRPFGVRVLVGFEVVFGR